MASLLRDRLDPEGKRQVTYVVSLLAADSDQMDDLPDAYSMKDAIRLGLDPNDDLIEDISVRQLEASVQIDDRLLPIVEAC